VGHSALVILNEQLKTPQESLNSLRTLSFKAHPDRWQQFRTGAAPLIIRQPAQSGFVHFLTEVFVRSDTETWFEIRSARGIICESIIPQFTGVASLIFRTPLKGVESEFIELKIFKGASCSGLLKGFTVPV